MIYLFASDIHGSSSATERLLDVFQKTNSKKLILLGDLLYHGPRNALPSQYNPQLVGMLLNKVSNSIICVRGNCEAEVDQMMLSFPALNESAWMMVNDLDIYLHHGHKELPPLPAGTVVVSGHTHIPLLEKRSGLVYVNPGSVALPKGGFEPSYALLDGRSFSIIGLKSGEVLMSLTI